MIKRLIVRLALAAVGLFVLIQLVPYGRDHNNPPVGREVAWNSPQTQQLAVRACYDCHSSRTTWPWYSNVAPISWLIYHDVQEGREKMNFTEADRSRIRAGEVAEQVSSGKMPQWYYVLLHPDAKLSAQEKDQLIQGLNASPGGR